MCERLEQRQPLVCKDSDNQAEKQPVVSLFWTQSTVAGVFTEKAKEPAPPLRGLQIPEASLPAAALTPLPTAAGSATSNTRLAQTQGHTAARSPWPPCCRNQQCVVLSIPGGAGMREIMQHNASQGDRSLQAGSRFGEDKISFVLSWDSSYSTQNIPPAARVKPITPLCQELLGQRSPARGTRCPC